MSSCPAKVLRGLLDKPFHESAASTLTLIYWMAPDDTSLTDMRNLANRLVVEVEDKNENEDEVVDDADLVVVRSVHHMNLKDIYSSSSDSIPCQPQDESTLFVFKPTAKAQVSPLHLCNKFLLTGSPTSRKHYHGGVGLTEWGCVQARGVVSHLVLMD